MSMDVFHHVLNKYWYPRCLGQAAATWVLSPLGSNIILSMLKGKDRADKYGQIHKALKNKKTNQIETALFLSPMYKDAEKFKSIAFSDISKYVVDFNKSEGALNINQWIVNQNMVFNAFSLKDNIPPLDTKFALINICNFEIDWKSADSKGRVMKIHNSFNYTQDVNYEARMLEIPMRDEDYRLVVLVPNEVDFLNTLFRRLTNEGLAACFASVQPLFTVDSMLKTPNISISSETDVDLDGEGKSEFDHENLVQRGLVIMDNQGAHAFVVSCLYSRESKKPSRPEFIVTEKEEKPFFFAITFKDTPIYIGQYIPPT